MHSAREKSPFSNPISSLRVNSGFTACVEFHKCGEWEQRKRINDMVFAFSECGVPVENVSTTELYLSWAREGGWAFAEEGPGGVFP